MVLATTPVRTSDRVVPRPSERRRPVQQTVSSATLPVSAPVGARIDHTRLAPGIAAVLILASVAGFAAAEATGRAQSAAGVVVAPLLALGVLVGLRRWAAPVAGTGFVWIALGGFGLRLLAAIPRLIGGADAFVYHREGARMAAHFRALEFGAPTGRSIPGTGAVRYFVGLVHVPTNSSLISTYLIFTTLAFVGLVLFLLGVRRVMTDRQFLVATIFVMAWPSLAFWPSSIGKEALVVFGVGLAVVGVARLHERSMTGLPPLVLGVVAIGLVRPHVAMIALAALGFGLLARTERGTSRVLGHVAVLAIVLIGTMWLAGESAELFKLESIDGIDDLSAALDFAQARTSQDQARFVAPRVSSPVDYPWAVITVLFRPFPWEASNLFALVSGVEGLVLGALMIAAIPGLMSQWRTLLSRGLWLNLVSFMLLFVFFFSAIGNFGILTRQRSQVLPFVIVLVAAGLGWQRQRSGRQVAVIDVRRPASGGRS